MTDADADLDVHVELADLGLDVIEAADVEVVRDNGALEREVQQREARRRAHRHRAVKCPARGSDRLRARPQGRAHHQAVHGATAPEVDSVKTAVACELHLGWRHAGRTPRSRRSRQPEPGR